MPPPSVVTVGLRPRPAQGDTNTLVFPLVGIRRMDVYLKCSKDVRRMTADVWWWISAWAVVVDPQVNLPGHPSGKVNLAPSRVAIPQLGAGLMHVATVFWPNLPPAASLNMLFSTNADQPQGNAMAYGYADTTPHPYSGVFVAPFGFTQIAPRLVSPLPEDPATVQRLLLDNSIVEDQLPPITRNR
jgi:hypothetical protein